MTPSPAKIVFISLEALRVGIVIVTTKCGPCEREDAPGRMRVTGMWDAWRITLPERQGARVGRGIPSDQGATLHTANSQSHPRLRGVVAAIVLSLCVTPTLTAWAEEPEDTPSPSVPASSSPSPTASVLPPPAEESPEPSPSAGPLPAADEEPTHDVTSSETTQQRQPRATAELGDPGPYYLGDEAKLVGSFPVSEPITVRPQVWIPSASRWSDGRPVRTSADGAFSIPLTWSSEYVSRQRWRVVATLPDGAVAETNEVELARVAAPKVTTDSPLGLYADATVSGSFGSSTALRAWGEVWRSDVQRWSSTAAQPTDATGGFTFTLGWGKDSSGTQRWRIAAQTASGRLIHTDEFSITRRRAATVSVPRVIPPGQPTSTWGNFDTRTPITVWAEVWRTDVNDWSSTIPVRTDASGDYTISLNYDIHSRGTQRWRIAGRFADGSIQYTDEFALIRRSSPTVSQPMVLPTDYGISTFGWFDTRTPITVWGEVWRDGYWSRTAPVSTDSGGDYTLSITYGSGSVGQWRWRVAGLYPDGTIQHTNEFTVRRTRPLDGRCLRGRVLCASKSDLRLWWIVDGTIRASMDARFGKPGLDTREGQHSVYWKSRYHVSDIYHTPMPWAMFFNGGQAVHYSDNFFAYGHTGGSAGCINVRDAATIDRVYGEVRVGDKVVVYR